MGNGGARNTFRVNVENLGYADVEENTENGYRIGEKKRIPGSMTIDLQFEVASGKLYGDGKIVANMSQITGATLKIGLNKLGLGDRCAILGHRYEGGIADFAAGDSAPEKAWYYEIPSDDGEHVEKVWLLCGTAQPAAIPAKQREENITYSTDELTVSFSAIKMKQGNKNTVIRMMDTSEGGATPEMEKAFESNPYPENLEGAVVAV